MMAPGTRVVITSLGRSHRVVACDCSACDSGERVAVDEYLGLKYPAVFPKMGARPTHYVARVVAPDRREAVEQRAAELHIGADR